MMPNGWNIKTLDSVSKITRLAGAEYSDVWATDPDGGIIALRGYNIENNKVNLRDVERITQEMSMRLNRSKLYKNDIVFPCVGSIGKAYLVEEDNKFHINQNIAKITPSKELAPLFLTYCLLSNAAINQILKFNTSSSQPNVLVGNLRKFKFAFPDSKSEQRKIAKILSTWDKAISTTERLIDNSKQQKKALMQQLLTGKKRLLDDSGKPFEDEWEEVKLKECATCLDNKRVPLNSSQRQEMQGEIPYWGANGIVDYVNEHIFDETIVLLAEDGGYFDEFSHRPIANISYGKSWVNNHAHILKAKNNSLNEWLYYSLVHKNILAFINGGTRAKLNKSDMLLIPINLPPIAEQTKIVGVLGNADQEISLLEKQLADLKQEKKALMQQLLTGKRRVKVDDEALA